MAHAANTVKLDPSGFVDIVVTGDQTYDSFNGVYLESLGLIKQLQSQNKPLNALIDVTNEGSYDLGSNKAAMNALESTQYDKVAIVGAKGAHKEVTHLIILAMGKTENTKMFEDRASGLAWLMGTS